MAAALGSPETPVAGPDRCDAHLQPMRSFFRCMISAQAHALQLVEALSDRLAASPHEAPNGGFQRLYATLSDLMAARSAFARWKTACSLNWGHLGDARELRGFQEMLATTLKYDLLLEEEAKRVGGRLMELHAAVEAWGAASAAGSAGGAAGADPATAAAAARLREALHSFAALKREALGYDSVRLLGWVSRVFDRRLSEHALQTLLYGPVVPLREVASVCRWALRNQASAGAGWGALH